MTDLLMRLAERTLGTAPTARPVIASMFESMPAPGSSLSAPQPAFSDMEEFVEADAPAQPARMPHVPIITRPASGIMDQQPPVPSVSPITEAASDTAQTRASIAPRQVESAGVSGIETRQDGIVSILREQVGHLAPLNETISPAPLVNAPPVELTQARPVIRVPIVSGHPADASTPIAHTQSAPLPAKAPPNVQAFPPEIHEQSPARAFAEQRRTAETPPILQHHEQPRREADSASLLVQMPRQEVTPAQYISREVIAVETAPALPSQQQGRRPGEGSTAQEAGHTRLFNQSDTSPSDQLTLVPDRSSAQFITQIIEQAPANQQIELGIENRSSRHAISQQVGQVGPRIVEKSASGTAEAPAEAPTIRVTIGRIDVRAVTPAAPTTRAKPTRAGPAVSLEEYTRQNRGGR